MKTRESSGWNRRCRSLGGSSGGLSDAYPAPPGRRSCVRAVPWFADGCGCVDSARDRRRPRAILIAVVLIEPKSFWCAVREIHGHVAPRVATTSGPLVSVHRRRKRREDTAIEWVELAPFWRAHGYDGPGVVEHDDVARRVRRERQRSAARALALWRVERDLVVGRSPGEGLAGTTPSRRALVHGRNRADDRRPERRGRLRCGSSRRGRQGAVDDPTARCRSRPGRRTALGSRSTAITSRRRRPRRPAAAR